MVAELPADFGSLEALSIEGELQTIYFALLVLHALYDDAVLVQLVERNMECPVMPVPLYLSSRL